MVTAVIVLSVVAVALGGYLAFDILRGRKTAAEQSVEPDIPQTAEDDGKAAEEQPAPEIGQADKPEATEPEAEQADEPVDEHAAEPKATEPALELEQAEETEPEPEPEQEDEPEPEVQEAAPAVPEVEQADESEPEPEPEPVSEPEQAEELEAEPEQADEPAPAPEPEQAEETEQADETGLELEQADELEADGDEAMSVADEEDKDDAVTEIKPVAENGKTRYIVIKYSKSFTAKLIQSDDPTKRYYSELKNKLLSYDGVKSRISWKWETFRSGRKTLAKLRLRGKTLAVTLALNPDDYAGTKYYVESLANVKSSADTPCMYRVKNDRRLLLAKELIAKLMADYGLLERANAENTDYAAQYPYEDTDALIEKKLIKVLTDRDAQSGNKFKPGEVRESVTATEVDKIMSDEVAASLIEKSDGTVDKTKQGIINIDTLSQNFESGEVVTLAEIKKRIKGFGKTTYIKVLARGTLDKPLIVEADTFSLQAVKMIVLTGGTAIKKR